MTAGVGHTGAGRDACVDGSSEAFERAETDHVKRFGVEDARFFQSDPTYRNLWVEVLGKRTPQREIVAARIQEHSLPVLTKRTSLNQHLGSDHWAHDDEFVGRVGDA